MEAAKESAAIGKITHKGSVANMGLGEGKFEVFECAVSKAVDNGMRFAVAAGNDNRDACNYSPVLVPQHLVTSALTSPTTASVSTFSHQVSHFEEFFGAVSY